MGFSINLLAKKKNLEKSRKKLIFYEKFRLFKVIYSRSKKKLGRIEKMRNKMRI